MSLPATPRGRSAGVLDLALLGVLADAPMHGYQLRTRLAEILGPARAYSYGSLYPALRRLHRAGDLAVTELPGEPGLSTEPDRPTERRTRIDPDTPTEQDRPAVQDRPAEPGPPVGSNAPGPAVPGASARGAGEHGPGEHGAGDPRSTRARGRVTYRITEQGTRRLADLLADDGPQSWTDEGFGVHLALFARTAAPTRLRILQGRRRRLEQLREGLRACLPTGTGQDDDLADLHRLAIQAHDREMLWIRGLIAREGGPPDRAGAVASAPDAHGPPPVPDPAPQPGPATPTTPTTRSPYERSCR